MRKGFLVVGILLIILGAIFLCRPAPLVDTLGYAPSLILLNPYLDIILINLGILFLIFGITKLASSKTSSN